VGLVKDGQARNNVEALDVVRDGNRRSAVHFAASNGNNEIVKYIVKEAPR
jgi:hypothetical protein